MNITATKEPRTIQRVVEIHRIPENSFFFLADDSAQIAANRLRRVKWFGPTPLSVIGVVALDETGNLRVFSADTKVLPIARGTTTMPETERKMRLNISIDFDNEDEVAELRRDVGNDRLHEALRRLLS